MQKDQKEYRQFLAEIGPEASKKPLLLTHRNGITTGWKVVGEVSRDNHKARKYILEENLAKKCEFELTQLLLPEHGVQGKEATKPFKKIARTERVDKGL